MPLRLVPSTDNLNAPPSYGGGMFAQPSRSYGVGDRSRSGTESYGFADGSAINADGYPPLQPAAALTAGQVLDIGLACEAAMQSGEPAPLRQPFTYQGQGTPGIQTGDHITHMLFQGGQCITNAEAERRGIAAPGGKRMWMCVGGLAIVGALGGWLASSSEPKRRRPWYAGGGAAVAGAIGYWACGGTR